MLSSTNIRSGLPLWLIRWRICLQCRRPGFNLWVGKIPWRRERLPTPVFWPREFHGLYSTWGCKESDKTELLSLTYLLSDISLLLSIIIWTFITTLSCPASNPDSSTHLSSFTHKYFHSPLWNPCFLITKQPYFITCSINRPFTNVL